MKIPPSLAHLYCRISFRISAPSLASAFAYGTMFVAPAQLAATGSTVSWSAPRMCAQTDPNMPSAPTSASAITSGLSSNFNNSLPSYSLIYTSFLPACNRSFGIGSTAHAAVSLDATFYPVFPLLYRSLSCLRGVERPMYSSASLISQHSTTN